MQRTRLVFREMSQLVGSEGLSVAMLTDLPGKRVLSVICDRQMTDQMAIRLNRQPNTRLLLPEVLLEMMTADGKALDHYELYVYGIVDGQYKVSLLNRLSLTLRPIRMSDAVMLSYISHIPLYIDEQLMQRQCSEYVPFAPGISIPINTIDTERLNKALEKAISEENYRLASHLHEEIKRREENERMRN